MRSNRLRIGAVLAAVAIVAGVGAFVIATRDDATYESMPWSQALVSADGKTLTLLVDPVGDPHCMAFDHIELTHRGERYDAAAMFKATAEFCAVPCPIGVSQDPHTVRLSTPVAASAVDHAPSQPSCQR